MESLGYHSYASRSRHQLVTWVVSVLGFVAQQVLTILLLGTAIMSMFREACTAPHPHVDEATTHGGRIYFTSSSLFGSDEKKKHTPLFSIDPEQGGAPRLEARLDLASGLLSETPRLAVSDGKLVVITSKRLGTFNPRKKAVSWRPVDNGSYGSRIFVHDGRPVTVSKRSGADYQGTSIVISVLDGDRWEERKRVSLGAQDVDVVKVVPQGEKLHIFVDDEEGTVYHCPPGSGARRCKRALKGEGKWCAAILPTGRPALFRIVDAGEDEAQDQLEGWVKREGDWRRVFSEPVWLTTKIVALRPDPGGKLALLTDTSITGVQVHLLEESGERVTSRHSYSSSSPFRKGLALVALTEVIPGVVTLFVALLVGLSMRRWRVAELPNTSVRLAGLGRRALARTLDSIGSAIVPGAVVGLLYLRDPASLTSGLVVWLCLGWGCLLLVVFSFLEGIWGVTPGKWLLGIRVLRQELRHTRSAPKGREEPQLVPCGFSRALLRNLALLVDGLADCLVGVLIIALSARWQRLGDMLADTVVVRTRDDRTPTLGV